MLRITEDDAHDCFVLEPSGKLRAEDFAALTERFNARVNVTDRVPNIVIHAPDFPGWADFAALLEHIRFVRDHQRMIQKVALVSDTRFLDFAPRIARYFVQAELRHFPANALAAALAWVTEPSAEPASDVTLIDGLPDDTIGVSVRGVVTARDYAETIVPLIETKLKAHRKLKMIYRIGPEFEAFTPGAVWSDARVGMMHLTDFAKVAVVSDVPWIRHAVRVFAPLVPGQVHVFADRELAAAKAWVATDEATG